MAEFDDEIFKLPNDKKFCKVNLDQITAHKEKIMGLERVETSTA